MEEKLLIFAADHRGSLKSKILGIKKEPNKKQLEQLHEFKSIILEAFKFSIEKGLNKNDCVLLMEEDYGAKQLKEAKKLGIKIIIPVEKSGLRFFDFNYRKNFEEHIEKFNPEYVKVLLHFNPENKDENKKTLKNLRIFNNWLTNTNYKFLIEVLVNPTEEQLKKYGKRNFDLNVRPKLTIESINQLNKAGIFPSIWKLEGYEKKKDLDFVSSSTGDANIVILGSSESMSSVLRWLKIGATNKKVVGFAVGRTLFMDSFQKYYKKQITRERAVKTISSRYLKIANFFLNELKRNKIV